MALALCPLAIKTLHKALNDERLCVQASIAILDRGLGKPAQAHTGEGGGPIKLLVGWMTGDA